MKVMVAVKRVVDYNVKIHIKTDGSGVDLSGVKMSLNPFDEIAVEEAVRLKEKGFVSEISVVSIGDRSCQESLRTALALGADKAIHIETSFETQPLGVAKALKELVNRERFHLIILGKQAIDDDYNQTGQMLAALLRWPQGTFVSQLTIVGEEIEVVREVDGGLETLKMPLPAVITTDLRLNVPRYATLPNIMKAKQKPLEVISAEALGIDLRPHLKTLTIVEPSKRKAGIKVADVDELLEKLHKEAKVI
ncbi:MAG: electron transfer flavoprotein subunit beta/FixA family protein [Alphaproteobacteria bacterium]|nr:electron transfer flavoprotein subunit beta/FixA family protein [Alphaproteobacteria bacterium]